ncbi:MAG: LLM class flavin-dependent oxidoreductase [Proteobacteria bacterium]|nr:LLM class flavin-dependent oxidoreductase [Pseudomonadota bacterium]MCH8257953.1 LLM class flavin-dependent oxidoreductase [Pseudomonadota bacterium]
MTVPQRTALTLPDPRGVEATIELAKWAEDEGYDDLWFADSSGVDALTTAAAVAINTQRCRIGTAIIPVFSRTPAVLASTAHVLNKLSKGRFILGLGSSSQTMMENWHGQKFEKPLSRVKETTLLIKSMLSGEKSDFDGDTVQSHGYRQIPLEAGEQPVYMAALRGKMLEAAAEFSDGVILNLFPKDALPKMMEHIRIGAERAGKKLEDVEIVCRHQIIVTDDKPGARDLIRRGFAPYYATPVYNAFLAWAGYEDVAKTIAEGWAAKDRAKTTGALDDALVDDIAILGSLEECQDRIREYADGGITTHIVSCVSPAEAQTTFEAFTASKFSF